MTPKRALRKKGNLGMQAHGVDTTTPSSIAKKAGPRSNVTRSEVKTFVKGVRPKRYSLETKKDAKGRKLYRTTAHHGKSSFASSWNADESKSRDQARNKFLKSKAKQI